MSDVVHLSNPAGRLYELAKTVVEKGSRLNDNHHIRSFVADYIGFDSADNAVYFAAIAEVMALPVAVRRMVGALERPVPSAAILLRPIDQLEPVLPDLGVNGAGMRSFAARIAQSTVDGLEVTSEVLAHATKSTAPTDESLTEIRDLANHMVDVMAGDDSLSPEFREAIRLHAQSIIDAVNRYKVNGTQALITEADALVGVYVRHRDEAMRGNHPVMDALRKLVSRIMLATALMGAPGSIAATVDVFAALPAPTVIEAPAEVPTDGA